MLPMQWSKLKKAAESRVCQALRGRLEFRATSYRHAHDGSGRGWITLDGHEIVGMSELGAQVERWKISSEIQSVNDCADCRDPAQAPGYVDSIQRASTIAAKQAVFSYSDFVLALVANLDLSIDDALASSDPIIRALAMIDRRVGKRRLAAVAPGPAENPLVRMFYKMRIEAEGLADQDERNH